MYTVLIYDNRTAESLKPFKPLFEEMNRKNELGVCEWSRELSDRRVEVALPKLYEMIGDKKEWRAIVIQSELGDEDGEYKVDPENPFDYAVNREAYLAEINRAREAKSAYDDFIKSLDPEDPEYAEKVRKAKVDCEPNFNMHEESTIPLVNLTQMLGGVPKQSPIFIDSDQVLDERTQKYTNSVITVQDKEAEENYRKLERKFHFQANRPKELILIATRPQQEETLKKVKNSWTDYNELESSQFWSYNHYATCCRFLTYEVEQKGSIQAQGDMFKLCMIVGLLATNELDPSTFQAYHLHSVKVQMDRELLSNVFKSEALTLASASKYLNNSIALDNKRFMNEKIDPPKYKVGITVGLEEHKVGDVYISEDDYGLAALDDDGDVKNWIHSRDEANDNLSKLRRIISRSVEGAAEQMRGKCKYNPAQVEPLSNFQTKEFNEQLKDTYQEILDDQVRLPFDEISALYRERHEEQKTVMNMILERMNAEKLITGYVTTAVAVLFAILPSLVHSHNTDTSVLIPILGCLAVSALIYFVVLFIVAFIQRSRLREEIGEYNKILHKIKNKIDENAAAYSKFLSDVASHMTGSSYINILQHKLFKKEDLTQQKIHHLEEINKFKLVLEEWARSLYVDCDFNQADNDGEFEFDEYDLPNFETLYTLEYGTRIRIPINKTGELISSYSFITGLEVVREELYDDVIFARDLDGRDS